MNIKTLVAASALAVASTAAVADSAAVTTPTGELVMVEKNAGPAIIAPYLIIGAFSAIAVIASGGGS